MSRKLKPLVQNDFGMSIVEDLGMIEYGNNGDKSRYAIFQCTRCEKKIKLRVAQTKKDGKDGICRECKISIANTRHGNSGDRLHKIWMNMLWRCRNKDVKYYGAKGIEVEFKDYDEFKEWSILNGYNENLSIDRIDGNGNYSKENCRWATDSIQTQNTEKLYSHNTSGYRGVCFDKKADKYLSQIKVNGKSVYLGRFDTKELAAKAYDEFVINNKLHHTLNKVKA